MKPRNTQTNMLPVLMWLMPLAFFAYQFILRLWPSLLMNQIMQQFAIDATAFGLLASSYYYGYAGLQIPMAIFLDRYSANKVIGISILICGVANYVFTNTDSWALALLSRFLIGAGSAIGFLGVSKVISQWFSPDKYGKMVGYSFTIGLLGAIYGGRPVNALLDLYGWQQVALVLSAVAISLAVMVYIFLKEPRTTKESSDRLQLKDLKTILASKQIVLLALANFLLVGSLEGFADIWGVNFLMKSFNISKSEAAQLNSFIYIGMIFGGPILAYISTKLGTYNVITCCSLGMALILTAVIKLDDYMNLNIVTVLFFILGIFCCYQVLMFDAGSKLVSLRLLGITVAFLNCINMLGGSFFHSFIGLVMDLFWTGETRSGIRIYDEHAYDFALMVIPVCAIIGGAMVFYVAKISKK